TPQRRSVRPPGRTAAGGPGLARNAPVGHQAPGGRAQVQAGASASPRAASSRGTTGSVGIRTSGDPARVAGAGGSATRAVSVACSGDVGNGDLPAQGRLDASHLGRTTPTPLVRDDPAVDEQLAAPHAPRLLT